MQTELNLNARTKQQDVTVEEYQFEPIKGYPMLQWQGKRPFTSTQFFPAQLKEAYGEETDGWMNQIFWGDNLQVMSHLLKKFRGQVDLIYIDPPYDSNADYKKNIVLRNSSANSDFTAFEEKQYHDIWSNDEYLQFMYERLILMRELLSDKGSIWVHIDFRRDSYIRAMLDEIFGPDNLRSQIIWNSTRSKSTATNNFGVNHNTLYYYTKSNTNCNWNQQYVEYEPDKLDRYYCFFEDEIGKYKKYTKSQMRGFRLNNVIPEGRRFALIPLLNLNKNRPNLKYEFLGFDETWAYKKEKMQELFEKGLIVQTGPNAMPLRKQYLDEVLGIKLNTIWHDITPLNSQAVEKVDYPTQKPEALLERIVKVSTNPGDLVFDCFMGSGTIQAVAMKHGRRFLGADINLGAIQTTTKRLVKIASDLNGKVPDGKIYTGFQVYNVNHYDVFRNPLEAKELLMKALEIEPAPAGGLFDGEKDGRMVKVMPVNRIATRADLNELLSNIDIRAYESRKVATPNRPVEQVTLVCMGHEPDLGARLKAEVKAMGYTIDVDVVDVLRDRSKLEFKREAEAVIAIENNQLLIREFYPMNLLQKLSLMKKDAGDWKELVESVLIDWNYDGAVLEPVTIDIPEGNNLVRGVYAVPANHGTIRIKITDLLSESLELTVEPF